MYMYLVKFSSSSSSNSSAVLKSDSSAFSGVCTVGMKGGAAVVVVLEVGALVPAVGIRRKMFEAEGGDMVGGEVLDSRRGNSESGVNLETSF